MDDFADKIAKLCIEKYTMLSKTGKPSDKEWTVLSGIILKKYDGALSLVALATGTKCLGGSDLLNAKSHEIGSRLSDSHAEILARRAFLRYLYEQIDLILNGAKSEVFMINDERKIKLNAGISFHFFSSQTPCGDCSIFLKDELPISNTPPVKIRKLNNDNEVEVKVESNSCKEEIIKDIHRTGAKCVKTETCQDPRLAGVNYHAVGPLRTKPGRGNPTLSMSCSDKMAKWIFLGLQGSLLSILIPRINMESVIIGGDCPFSLEAMERGLYKRFTNNNHDVKIMQSKLSFGHKKESERQHPCPSSIIWCAVHKRNVEVAVEGRKQGATKKAKGSYLLVCRRALFEMFLKTCDKYQNFDSNIRHPKKITYSDCKQWSKDYQRLWTKLKAEPFCAWPSKPSYLGEFVL